MIQQWLGKTSVTAVCLCITLLLWCSGCSREEASAPLEKPSRVVMPIKRPAPEKAEAPTSITEAPTEAKQTEEEKIAAHEQEPPQAEATAPEAVPKEEARCYTVKRGESLATIAGRAEVYGDPLKWPILYRLNVDKLAALEAGEDLLDRDLPEGLKLRIIMADEARNNVAPRLNWLWAVNVLSATSEEKIIPPALKLIAQGYPAYLTRATVKGRQWLRLRVGFFKTKGEADREGRKIMALLNLGHSWLTRVGNEELEKYGGY